MTERRLRNKVRKLAKELYKESLIFIDKSLPCVECDAVDHTDNGLSYAILNAFLKSKQYPITRAGSHRLIQRIIKQNE